MSLYKNLSSATIISILHSAEIQQLLYVKNFFINEGSFTTHFWYIFFQLLSIFNNKNILFSVLENKNYFSTLTFLMPFYPCCLRYDFIYVYFLVGHSRFDSVWWSIPTTKYLKKEHMPIVLWKYKTECSLCSKNKSNVFLANKVVWRFWCFFLFGK